VDADVEAGEGDVSVSVNFRKIQAGTYATEDGRFQIEQQPYQRECDCLACQVGGECPRNGWAIDWFWIIWDNDERDYANGTDASSFLTLREAKEWFA
jgi:hypothetical protein